VIMSFLIFHNFPPTRFDVREGEKNRGDVYKRSILRGPTRFLSLGPPPFLLDHRVSVGFFSSLPKKKKKKSASPPSQHRGRRKIPAPFFTLPSPSLSRSLHILYAFPFLFHLIDNKIHYVIS